MGVGTKPIEPKELSVEKLSTAINTVVSDRQISDCAVRLGKQIRSEHGVKNAVKAISSYLSLR